MLTCAREAEPVACFKDCPQTNASAEVSGGHSSDSQWLLTGTMLGGVCTAKAGPMFLNYSSKVVGLLLLTAENTY